MKENFVELERVHKERYQFIGIPIVRGVSSTVTLTADLHNGFARLRCYGCEFGHLVSFFLKASHYTIQKRLVEVGNDTIWIIGQLREAAGRVCLRLKLLFVSREGA